MPDTIERLSLKYLNEKIPTASEEIPAKSEPEGSAGISRSYAKADHIHPNPITASNAEITALFS